jgi:hypothetical protein
LISNGLPPFFCIQKFVATYTKGKKDGIFFLPQNGHGQMKTSQKVLGMV